MNATVRLRRTLSTMDAVWIGLGSVFGTGLFVAMGLGAQQAGGWVVLAVLIAFACAACNGLSSASLAAAHPVAGGTYAYGRRYLNNSVGFSAGVLFLLAKSASAATGAQLLGLVLMDAVRVTNDGVTGRVASVVVVAAVTLVVLLGARRSARVNAVIVGVTLLALAAWAVAGAQSVREFLSGGVGVPGAGGVGGVGVGDVLTASSLVFVAYTGYGRVATMGEEVKDPSRVIPQAVIITLGVSMLAYLVAAVLEASGVRAVALSGPLGVVVAVGIAAAVLGSLLNLVLGLSRVVLAMSRDGELPGVLSRSRAADAREPARSVIAVGVVVGLLTLIGDIEVSWRVSAAAVLAYYAVTNLAATRLDAADARANRRFCAPRVVPVVGLVMCTTLAFFAGWWAVLAAFGSVAVTSTLRGVLRRSG